jgi:ABC-type sugar transport system ATPase subunit
VSHFVFILPTSSDENENVEVTSMRVELQNVSKTYDNEAPAVIQLNLNVGDGELVTILGPSGCGKSTSLLMIAGIYPVSAGGIYFDGQPMNGVQPKDRNLGMVFQHSALYPNMNVQDNIAFPLKNKGVSRKERLQRAAEVAKQVHMGDYITRKPNQLSGGQQQRVAIARAIVKKPNLLLLDEPLSSLDANLRANMREEIRRLQKELGITAIMVTHDQEEALSMSDKIAVMNGGALQQFGTPQELYNDPANLFVARFLGLPAMNELECTWETVGQCVRVTNTAHVVPLPPLELHEKVALRLDQRVRWAFRPHQVKMSTAAPTFPDEYLSGKVVLTEYTGREQLIHLAIGKTVVKAVTDIGCEVHEGQSVWFQVDGNLYMFDADSGLSLYSEAKWESHASQYIHK